MANKINIYNSSAIYDSMVKDGFLKADKLSKEKFLTALEYNPKYMPRVRAYAQRVYGMSPEDFDNLVYTTDYTQDVSQLPPSGSPDYAPSMPWDNTPAQFSLPYKTKPGSDNNLPGLPAHDNTSQPNFMRDLSPENVTRRALANAKPQPMQYLPKEEWDKEIRKKEAIQQGLQEIAAHSTRSATDYSSPISVKSVTHPSDLTLGEWYNSFASDTYSIQKEAGRIYQMWQVGAIDEDEARSRFHQLYVSPQTAQSRSFARTIDERRNFRSNNAAIDAAEAEITKKLQAAAAQKPTQPIPMPYMGDARISDSIDEQYYKQSLRFLDDARKISRAYADNNYNGTSTAQRVLRGIGDNLITPEAITMGFSAIADNANLMRILEKDERGEQLSDAEETLLSAAIIKQYTEAAYASGTGIAYNIGAVTGESLPYMLSFVATGIPIKAATSGISKRIVNFVGRQLQRKGIGRIATRATKTTLGLGGNIATSALQAPIMPSTYSDYLDRRIGTIDSTTDGMGNISFSHQGDNRSTAALKAYFNTLYQNFGERSGEAISSLWGMFGRGIGKIPIGRGKSINDIFNTIHDSRLGKFWDVMQGTAVADFMRQANYDGVFAEVVEEYISGILNAATIGDQSFEELFSQDNLLTTMGGIALTSVMLGSANATLSVAATQRIRTNFNRSSKAAQQYFSPEQLNQLIGISGGSVQDITTFLAANIARRILITRQISQLADRRRNGETGIEAQINALGAELQDLRMQYDFVNASAMYNAYIGGLSRRIEPMREQARAAIRANGDPATGLTIQVDINGRQGYLIGGNYNHIQDSDGNISVTPTGDLATVLFDGDKTPTPNIPMETISILGVRRTDDVIRDGDRAIFAATEQEENAAQAPATGSTVTVSGSQGNFILQGYDPQGNAIVTPLNTDGTPAVKNGNPITASVPSENIIPEEADNTSSSIRTGSIAYIDGIPYSVDQVDGENAIIHQLNTDGTPVNDEQGNPITSIVPTATLSSSPNPVQHAASQNTPDEQQPTPEQPATEQDAAIEETNTQQQPAIVDDNITETPSSALSRIPIDKNGKPIYEQSDPETAYDAILQQADGDTALASRVILSMIDNKEAALNKLSKAKPRRADNPADIIKAEKELAAQIKQAESDLQFWKDTALVPSLRNQAQKEAEANSVIQDPSLADTPDSRTRDNDGSGNHQGIGAIQADVASTQENSEERLTHEEALAIISDMEKHAEVAPEIELTPENWVKEFGNDGIVNTPIGEVKQGDNQYLKLAQQGRNSKLGMVRPTLERPSIIILDERPAREGKSDRDTSFVFIKTFIKEDGTRYYYFTSVTVSKEGKEVVISSQERSANRISKLLQQGKIAWIDTAFSLHPTTQVEGSVPLNDSNTPTVTDNQPALLGINSSELSQNKDNEKSPISSDLGEKIATAEAETDTNPTEAQKEAGNYRKGHVQIGQFNVSIENPKGSVRSGVDVTGREWTQTMQNTYGYIRGTEGVDGDHIDVFLANDIDGWNGSRVFVIDQYNEDGTFDEHKVMIGFNDEADAYTAYLANYESGWADRRKIVCSSVNMEDFEKWIDSSHRKTKPFTEYKTVAKESKTVGEASTETGPSKTDGYTVERRFHKKNGTYIHAVKFTEQMPRERFMELKKRVKDFGGYYSSFGKGGFIFEDEADAHKFANAVLDESGERLADAAPVSLADTRKASDTTPEQPKQVDVIGLMEEIREKGEAKLSDHVIDPSEQNNETSAQPETNPSGNRIVSEERYAELRERMRKKLGGQLNMGIDPEMIAIGAEMAVYHIEKGARKFAEYAKAMIADLGDAIRPYLKVFYNAARDLNQEFGYNLDGIEPYDVVMKFDVANFDKEHADPFATAETVVTEQEIDKHAEEAKSQIINRRNNERRKEDEQTAADTEAIASQAETTASQAESDIEAATNEQQINEIASNIDTQIEKVNEQLALLGYYEAEFDDKDFNEAYGYMRNAEKKAVKDANSLAKRLVKDLGITPDLLVDNKGKKIKNFAKANIAPAGGNITITLPLMNGRQLKVYISLESTSAERGEDYINSQRGDNLYIEHIMYRVENPEASGYERYGNNQWIRTDADYDYMLRRLKYEARNFLPKAESQEFVIGENIKSNGPKSFNGYKVGDKVLYTPSQRSGKPVEAVIHDFEDEIGHRPVLDTGLAPLIYEVVNWGDIKPVTQKETTEKTSKTRKKSLSSQKKIADLFGELFDNENLTEKDENGLRRINEVSSERLSADSDRHETRLSGSSEIGSEIQTERSRGIDSEREEGSNAVNRTVRPRFSDSVTTPKNTRNNHSERGENHAPTSVDARIDANIKAIKLANQLIENGEKATPEQMKVLRKFSGWGGLGKAFSDKIISQHLLELIGQEAYSDAVESANSGYYTPSYIIDTLWDIAQLMGFEGGNILEGSAGIGNILGQIPQNINSRSNILAIEKDSITGNILSLLYPDANVEIQGFENSRIPNGSIDLAITNVPFITGFRVYDTTGDKDLSKKFHNIQDFCIAKNVRKLREGGIGIFISSNGTLDNSKKLRDWIVNEGGSDFVGAFRLNTKTFVGTSVTSDIIVIRKRVNGRKSPYAIDASTIAGERTADYDTGETRKVKGKEVPIVKHLSMDYNRYFIEHPENMAGEMRFAFEEGDTFRPTSKGLYPVPGKNQEKMLADFVKSFADKEWTEEAGAIQTSDPRNSRGYVMDASADGKKLGEMYVKDGKLVIASAGGYYPLNVNSNKVKGHTKEECFNAYAAIKKALADVLEYQTNNESDSGLKPLLDKLNKAYDDFVATYGHFNKNTAIAFLRNDVDYPNVFSLEKFEESGDNSGNHIQTFEKSDVFSIRVVEKEKEPTPTNVKDGILASMFKFGRIDIPYIAEQIGENIESVKQDIIDNGYGFEDPTTKQIEVSFQYLSGNVREKLRQAEENNENGIYDKNIKALQGVLPMEIPAHLIDFTLGSSWIDPKLYEEYVKERTDIDVRFTSVGGTWFMDAPNYGLNMEKNRSMGVASETLHKTIFGHTLIEAAIQNRTITVSQTNRKWDGTAETIIDKEATQACAEKIDEIRQDFKEWARQKMQNDTDMSTLMERIYNDTFNNYVPMTIPDEFVPEYFVGASHKFKMRPHQGKAIVRGTMQPLMLAHEVGTGKTFTLISTAMEMRRLGTARKPMIVVQNATVGQFVVSAKELYPNAKILTLEEADRSAEGRKNFYAKIRYNDWDMIVVPQSTFEFIPDSEERQMAFIQDKIEEKKMVLEQMKEADPNGSSMITRQAEREIELLEGQLAEITDEATKKRSASNQKKRAVTLQNAEVQAKEMLDRRTDDVENFDDMGIDALLIDEAHEYKHLGFATAMQRGVKGVDPSYSKKSQGVYLKTQAVLEKNNGRNVIFATGTPISNTAAEIWTFMRYLMPADTMKEYGIYYFDDFVRNFGNIQQMLEFTTSGKFKENNRFAGYINLPELVRIWSGVSDTVLTREAEGVNDKIPEIEGGKAQDIYLPQTRALRGIMKFVKERLEEFENMSGKEKKKNSHIPLTMYGIAKAAAVDARLVQEDAFDDPNSKTNEAVRQTLRSLKETEGYKGTVAIFADNYQNKQSGFNLYDDIRNKLIAEGIPAEQVVIMRPGMTIKKKLEIFDKVNRGDIRVILGSTFTLGTGVNIHERLHTLIHLDAPNRPMDYTQRNGRILRQGNIHKSMGKPVRILRFGVEDSLDVTAYQRLKTKGAIADSIMDGKSMMDNSMTNRVLEEEEDLFGDTVAQLSGSEYALLKNNAEKNVRKYESRKKQWEVDQTYIHNAKPKLKALIAQSQQSIKEQKAYLEAIRKAFPNGTFSKITIGKHTFTSIDSMADYIKEHNKAILDEVKKMKESGSSSGQTRSISISLGRYTFNVKTVLSRETVMRGGQLFTEVHRTMTYSCPELGLSNVPVYQSLLRNAIDDIINNVITGKDFAERIEAAEQSAAHNRSELQQLESREGKPFEYQEELEQAKKQLHEYTEAMRKEMAEKEAKYAEIDASVETVENISVNEEENELSSSSSNILFREIPDQSTTQEQTNDRFNDELSRQIDGTLPKGHIYDLGMPSDTLLNAGLPNLPIEMAASRLSDKSMQENHPFDLSEIRNLPKAIQSPMAIFRSATHLGSFVVMTEIEHHGRNFVVAIQANRRKGRIEVNDIRSVYPKNNNQIANWVTEGLLEYVDKKRMVEWLSKQRSNSAEVRKLFNHATNIIQNFDNPKNNNENIRLREMAAEVADAARPAQVTRQIERLAREMNLPIEIIHSIDDIPDEYTRRYIQGEIDGLTHTIAGYYDRTTGKAYIILPAILQTADPLAEAERTILHEVIAHHGMQALMGRDAYDTLCDEVWNSLPYETRARFAAYVLRKNPRDLTITDIARVAASPALRRAAADEYIAALAEGGVENPTLWQRIKAFFRDLLRRLGFYSLTPTDADIRFMLSQARENLAQTSTESIHRDTDILLSEKNLSNEEQEIIDRAKADGTYLKAPNGEETNLTPRQWVQVRTQAFKQWFGDWEKAARIEKLRHSKPVIVKYNEEYQLNRDSAKQWLKDNIRGEYVNKDTGEKIIISKIGINEVTSHGTQNESHLKSLSAIPQMIENSVFIDELPNTKEHDKYDSYRYYVVGMKIDNVDYTAKIVVGVKGDSKYYDHRLTQIEKGTLIDNLNGLSNSVAENQNAHDSISKDSKLLSILQTNASKVVDTNGEPLVVYHGSRNFNPLAQEQGRAVFHQGNDGGIHFGTLQQAIIRGGDGNANAFFLNIRNIKRTADRDNHTSIIREAKKEGYDGTVYNNIFEAPGKSFVVFSPYQIKSATSNTGAFSSENPDIRFRELSAPEETMDNASRQGNDYTRAARTHAAASIDTHNPDLSPVEQAEAVRFRELLTRDFSAASDFLNSANLINAAMQANDGKAAWLNNIQEAVFDSMLRLRLLLDRMKKDGASIPAGFNPYLAENQSRSRAQNRIAAFNEDYRRPLIESLAKCINKLREENIGVAIKDNNAAHEALSLYAQARAAVERQEVKEREAREQAKADGTEYKHREWAGLPGIQYAIIALYKGEITDDVEANKNNLQWLQDFATENNIPTVEQYITMVEDALQKENIDNLWENIRRISEFQLTTSRDAGILSRGSYQLLTYGYNIDNIIETLYKEQRKKITDDINNGIGDKDSLAADLADLDRRHLEAVATATDLDAPDAITTLVAGGWITQEIANDIHRYYNYYLPLKGHAEITGEDLFDYNTPSMPRNASRIKSVRGHEQLARDPFNQILRDAEGCIMQAERNRWKQQLYHVLSTNRSLANGQYAIQRKYYQVIKLDDGTVRYEPYQRVVTTENNEDIITFVPTAEEIAAGTAVLLNSSAEFDIYVSQKQRSEHETIVYIDGSPISILFYDARIAKAVNGTNEAYPPQWMPRAIIQASRTIPALLTSWHPEFVLLSNPIRDTQEAIANAAIDKGFKYTALLARNLATVDRDLWAYTGGKLKQKKDNGQPLSQYEKYVIEFFENGGSVNVTQLSDYETTTKDLKKELKRALKGGKKPSKNFWKRLTEQTELRSRIATYITSRQTGSTIQDAINDAKEITVNFDRRGAQFRNFNLLQMFFNAQMQSVRRQTELMRRHPVRYATTVAILASSKVLIGLGISLLLGGGDDDNTTAEDIIRRYFEINKQLRTRNHIFIIDGEVYRIPVAPAFIPFTTLCEEAAQLAFDPSSRHRNTASQAILSVTSSVLETYVPTLISDPANIMININNEQAWRQSFASGIPMSGRALWQPFIEAIYNYDYTGNPIYTEPQFGAQHLPFHRDYRERTGKAYVYTSKLLSDLTGGNNIIPGKINIHPEQIEHVVQGLAGGIGTLAGRFTGIYKRVQGESAESTGLEFLYDIPFAARLYGGNMQQRENRYYQSLFFDDKQALEAFRAQQRYIESSKDMQDFNKEYNSETRKYFYDFATADKLATKVRKWRDAHLKESPEYKQYEAILQDIYRTTDDAFNRLQQSNDNEPYEIIDNPYYIYNNIESQLDKELYNVNGTFMTIDDAARAWAARTGKDKKQYYTLSGNLRQIAKIRDEVKEIKKLFKEIGSDYYPGMPLNGRQQYIYRKIEQKTKALSSLYDEIALDNIQLIE